MESERKREREREWRVREINRGTVRKIGISKMGI